MEQTIKQAEGKFQAFLESAPDAIVIVRQDGVITLINTQTEKLIKLLKNRELFNKIILLALIFILTLQLFSLKDTDLRQAEKKKRFMLSLLLILST